MTAIQILEHKLNELLKQRKLFYRRKKSDDWLEEKLIKWNKERTNTISDIRRVIKILNCV